MNRRFAYFYIFTLLFSFGLVQPLSADGQTIYKEGKKNLLIIRIFYGKQKLGHGSGFVALLNGKKYLITNYHVIRNGNFYLDFKGRKIKKYEILRVNIRKDIAILRFPGIDEFPAFPLALTDVGEGEKVFAMGFPGISGELRLNITDGIVSNRNLMLDIYGKKNVRYIQVSAAINPGISGGPVFNKDGAIIGVATLTWLHLSQVGAVIPVEEVIREIKLISKMKERGQAVKDIKERCKLIAWSIRQRHFYNLGKHYSKSLKFKIYPDVAKNLERVRMAVLLARDMYPNKPEKFKKLLFAHLTIEEFLLYVVTDQYFSRNKKASMNRIIGDPVFASEFFLSARFLYVFYNIAKLPLADIKLKNYEVTDVKLNQALDRATVKLKVKLEKKSFETKLKFRHEWGTWFLLPLSAP